MFLHEYLITTIIKYHHKQIPFDCALVLLKNINSQCRWRNVHHPFISFIIGVVPIQRYLYLVRDFICLLHLVTHLSKPGDEILYYCLYHEDTPFYLDVHTQLLNIPFVFFNFIRTIT